MTTPSSEHPAPNTLAIVGAGPVGLEAALAALDRGFDVHVFERGEVGAHVRAWGHVRFVTPWRDNVGATLRAHLEGAGWSAPPAEECPTANAFADLLLDPAAALPALAGRIHTHAQVVRIGRRGLRPGEAPADLREHPFRLHVRDGSARDQMLHAASVIDATGTYGHPDRAGSGGIPARGEPYLAPQMAYHVPDVLGLSRARHAGRRTLVIGERGTAAIVVADLATLADQVEGTACVWATRSPATGLFAGGAVDTLPERAIRKQRAHALAMGEHPAVRHIGGVEVEGFEFNSATHRYRVQMSVGDEKRMEEVDEVVVAMGFGPDESLFAELRVDLDPATRAPRALAEALRASRGADAAALAHPEPGFFIVGEKSWGRMGGFVLTTGYPQALGVVELLARG
jgi:thioredoxin reductase